MPLIRHTLRNLWDTLTEPSWEDVTPPSIVSTLKWLGAQVPRALGLGSPQEQVIASLVLTVVAVLSSIISLGATLVLAAFFLFITLPIGLIRHVPPVEDHWPLG